MKFLKAPIYTYSRARSLGYWLEYAALNATSSLLEGKLRLTRRSEKGDPEKIMAEAFKLLEEDAANITQGIYPVSVLWPESPAKHLLRFPRVLWDGVKLQSRRMRGKTTQFTREAEDYLNELPRYYRRNFHFQTDGYLSERSAEIYDHQVEMLFAGTADAMRRSILRPLKEHLGPGDGAGLTFLEIGAGTARLSRFLRQVYPKAKIIATDLSEPYLKVAARQMEDVSRISFLQADAAHLPFQDERFDAVLACFLFHELPLEVRKQVLSEAYRTLKPGGFWGWVDSVQKGDSQAFDPVLEDFPEDYHEPFYRNYIEHPMDELVAEAGFAPPSRGVAFASRTGWALKTRS